MRGAFRPIPKAALRKAMFVRLLDGRGGFGETRAISGVRFEKVQRSSDDAHRSADAGAGTVFVDAVNSKGAFEVPVGSRVVIEGHSYIVRECFAAEDLFSRIHHWELKVG